MPFVEMTKEEQEFWKNPCNHPEHDPPTHLVIDIPMKWKCPNCGLEVIIRPRDVSWG